MRLGAEVGLAGVDASFLLETFSEVVLLIEDLGLSKSFLSSCCTTPVGLGWVVGGDFFSASAAPADDKVAMVTKYRHKAVIKVPHIDMIIPPCTGEAGVSGLFHYRYYRHRLQ